MILIAPQRKGFNSYKINNDEVVIYLKRRSGEILETIIDINDLERIKKLDYSWHAWWNKDTQSYYARTTINTSINNKTKRSTPYLHKLIMDIEGRGIVDHIIPKETLNNRKNNLRVVTKRSNTINRKGANKNNKTGVRNVSYIESDGMYYVQFQIKGKNTIFDKFNNLEDAKKCAEENREKVYIINNI